ncbi:hypothetical protein ACFIJ5_04050 [Haloimpatiens sp. FM7330]|uniref:transglutaminase domain-containing protein n=1 Tax=Haloimpatiens sp. FM7330 TaxID=3298610 RepID=UPI0036326AD7
MRKKWVSVILVVILAVVLGVTLNKNTNKELKEKVSVKKWNNFYNGSNIHFYYQASDGLNIEQLEESYSLKKLVRNCKSDFEKALKIMEWTDKKLKYNRTSMKVKGNALGILKDVEKSGKSISDEDYCKVYNEAAISVGLKSRIGEFKVKEPNKEKGMYNYFICEVWSDKYKKWIMIDSPNNHYITHEGVPLSAIEVIEKGIDKIKILGGNSAQKYIKNMEKYFYSYTIAIDNNIYGAKKSNSYITYIKNDKIPKIYIKDQFIKPTIFTYKNDLFKISPNVKYKDNKSDEVSTIIFSQKKSIENNDNSKEKISLYGGAFRNSVMLEKYKVSVNSSKWEDVEGYFTVDLKNGENVIKISQDGKKAEREVIIIYNSEDKKK